MELVIKEEGRLYKKTKRTVRDREEVRHSENTPWTALSKVLPPSRQNCVIQMGGEKGRALTTGLTQGGPASEGLLSLGFPRPMPQGTEPLRVHQIPSGKSGMGVQRTTHSLHEASHGSSPEMLEAKAGVR